MRDKKSGLIFWPLVVCIFFLSSVTEGHFPLESNDRRYVEGEVIVKFKGSVLGVQTLIHQQIGAEVRRRLVRSNIELIRLPENLSVYEAVQYYLSHPEVEYAEPNYILSIQKIPADPLYSSQWGLRFISAPEAWDISTCDQEIIVAMIDTGLQITHPDISQNLWQNPDETIDGTDNDGNALVDDIYGWDFVNGDNDPADDHGHGTHIAGIIGAVGNNGIGITGVCWRVKLMPLKILDADGYGTVAGEIQAIMYAIEEGADVINASFGGGSYSNAERDAISMAKEAGVLFVSAAGNGGEDYIGDNIDLFPFYPASYSLENIVSVTANGSSGTLATFANFGATSVDLAAPGVYILSTQLGNSYIEKTGTSMATAFVTGAVALMKSIYPYMDYWQIKEIILRTVDKRMSLNGKVLSEGTLNLQKAAHSLLKPSALQAVQVEQNRVELFWIDNSSSEDGFIVERAPDGEFAEIGRTEAGITFFEDTSVSDGSLYRYRVKSFIEGVGSGEVSEELTVVTPLNPPTELSVLGVGSTEVSIGWVDNSSSEEGYIVERAEGDGGFVLVATLPQNTQQYSDHGLFPSTRYRYRIKAYNTVAGESESVEIEVTTTEKVSSGGGGGCSITRGPVESSKAVSEVLLFLFPLLMLMLKRIITKRVS